MVHLLDRTSSEPASYSPAPRASVDLPPVLHRDVRFGAAVYGSFLAASVIGVAYESGTDTRTMTASLLGSMLVFWAAHVWSEVVGERIRLADAHDRDVPADAPVTGASRGGSRNAGRGSGLAGAPGTLRR